MLKTLRSLMERVYDENHKGIKGIVNKDYDEDNITIYFHQDNNRITLTALKIDTQNQINLTAKKYSKLFDKYREVGEIIYKYKDKRVIINLNEILKVPNDKDITPSRTRVYGYCRVSSKGQLENNSLQQQAQEILQRYPNANINKEQYTGTTIDRPILNNLVSSLERDDILVVTKLDRLARTTKEGIEIIESLLDKGVIVDVLNIGRLDNSTIGRFFLTTLLAVSEMERAMIVERTQAGKAIARRKKGYKEGRPKKFTATTLKHALSLLNVNGGNMSYKEVEYAVGISKSTLIREQRKNIIKRKSISKH